MARTFIFECLDVGFQPMLLQELLQLLGNGLVCLCVKSKASLFVVVGFIEYSSYKGLGSAHLHRSIPWLGSYAS